MDLLYSLFRLLSGIGLFMFAMYLIEESLKNLSGRNFKIFLKKITKNNLGAAFGGAVVTGILQSSSMVSLMVLAFVGAGIFTMKNAIAIILGANLGTTLDSWIVAILGFNMDIEIIAYPIIFIGGFLLLSFGKRNAIKYLSFFMLGFGLLFIGLGFKKDAMELQVQTFDFAQYASMPSIFFLGIGFVITLLVQSSSVTMALTLSALHFGAIDFASAAAIVLGSETGTTIKIMLSAIGGNAAKKRVVLGNFIFNIIITLLAFLFLKPILHFIQEVLNVKNPLLALVTFSTCINLAGLFLFLPFLGPYTTFLTRFFKETNHTLASFIGDIKMDEPESAMELFQNEVEYFIYYGIVFNASMLQLEDDTEASNIRFQKLLTQRAFHRKTQQEQYDFIKQLQGEIQTCYLLLRTKVSNTETAILNQYIVSVRSAMYAVKCLHDIETNIDDLSKSSQDIKFDFFGQSKVYTAALYKTFSTIMHTSENQHATKLNTMYLDIQTNYIHTLNTFYKNAQNTPLDDIDMTLLLNFNRELFASNMALLKAVKNFKLSDEKTLSFLEQVNDLP